jgi:putative ABC transport system permease protein
LNDLFYSLRLLRQSRAFAAAAVLTLALGIGVNAAVFSVVNAFILRPLPVRDPDRLVVVASQRSSDGTRRGVSFQDLEDFRESATDVFDDVAGYSVGFAGVRPGDGPARRVLVTWVTGSYFPLLGIRPAAGRLFDRHEGGPGRTDAIAVLGYSSWQRNFHGDASVVGRTLLVNGKPCTIVGVAPSDFAGTFAFSDAEVYLPLNWAGGDGFGPRQSRGLHSLARLRAGVTVGSAQATINVVAERLRRQRPEADGTIAFVVVPERLARPEEDGARSNAFVAAVMLGLAALVLVVAAVNVVNLLWSRAASRRTELAIRAALGASRSRLVRQMITETLVLATLGGVAGALAGMWTGRILAAVRPPGDLPVRFDFHFDGRVLLYVAAMVAISGLLVGLVVALRASRGDLDRALRQSRRQDGPIGGRRMGGMLVVAQIATCFALLVAAGLLARSLHAAERVELGFRHEGVLNLHMDVAHLGYPERRGGIFFEEAERRVRAIPGVEDVAFAFTIPMGYIRIRASVQAYGSPRPGGDRVTAGKNIVSAGYFRTMGIPVVRGRSFSPEDAASSHGVAVINGRLGDLLWPGQDPVGRRFSASGPNGPWYEVVGVTQTGRYGTLFEDPQPYFYAFEAQEYLALRVLHIRTSLPPEALAAPVERAIRELEPDLPLYDVQSMTRSLGGGYGLFLVRLGAATSLVFGALGLVLALLGIYGVVAYRASRRTHEIGVRLALGAAPADILRLVLREGVTLVLAGLGAGLVVSLAGSRVLDRLVFVISARDPLTFAVVAPLLGGAALAACAIPALRASRVDPAVSLRSE